MSEFNLFYAIILWLAHIYWSIHSAFLWRFWGFLKRASLSAGWLVFLLRYTQEIYWWHFLCPYAGALLKKMDKLILALFFVTAYTLMHLHTLLNVKLSVVRQILFNIYCIIPDLLTHQLFGIKIITYLWTGRLHFFHVWVLKFVFPDITDIKTMDLPASWHPKYLMSYSSIYCDPSFTFHSPASHNKAPLLLFLALLLSHLSDLFYRKPITVLHFQCDCPSFWNTLAV